MTNQISKKIKELFTKSKHNTNPKKVIEDMVQMTFNLVTEPEFMARTYPNTAYAHKDGMRNELTSYKKDPAAWKLLQEIVMDYMQAIRDAEPFADIIGGMYDEYLGNVLGQFLTPVDVAEGVSRIMMAMMPPITEPINIGDPCGCGAGSLILSQLRAIYEEQGADALALVNVMAMDLDANMVRLCTVQIVLSSIIHRIPLKGYYAYWGNVITEFEKDTLAFIWEPNLPRDEFVQKTMNGQQKAMYELMKKLECETALMAA